MTAATLLLSLPAWAYTPAALGVPELGGPLAGPAEPGALGLVHSPGNAAHPPDGGHWSLLLDVGAVYTDLDYTLEFAPDEPQTSAGWGAVPSFATAGSLGPVGLGLSFLPLYSRGGDPYAEEGPQRFHTIEGEISYYEGDLAVAVRPHRSWRAGAALRIGRMGLSSRKSIDTGAIINDATDGGAEDIVGDPFLEGEQELIEHTGTGVGFALGLHYVPARGPTAHLAFRSPVTVALRGPVELVPSRYLALDLHGQVETVLTLPPEVMLSVEVPWRQLVFVVDLDWVGWSSLSTYESEIDDLEVSSADPAMQEIIAAYGIDELELLQAVTSATTRTQMHDVLSGGAAVEIPFERDWTLRPGIWILPASISDDMVHPSNLDFTMIDLRGAAGWKANQWLTVALGVDWYAALPRRIDETQHDLTDPGPTGWLAPDGAGSYSLAMVRGGLSLIVER